MEGSRAPHPIGLHGQAALAQGRNTKECCIPGLGLRTCAITSFTFSQERAGPGEGAEAQGGRLGRTEVGQDLEDPA